MPVKSDTQSAEITVFLALITAVMVTLIFTAVESARTRVTETYLQIAADSAADSLFSQYHLELWNEYRLLGTEMYSMQEVKQEYNGFLQMYLDGKEAVNWYCLEAGEEDLTVNSYQLMVDENGAVFEQQVKDYMSFGILLDLAGLESTETSLRELMSAGQTGEMSGKLSVDSGTVRKLDRKLKNLSGAVQTHNQQIGTVSQALTEGKDAERELRSLKKDVGAVNDLIPEIRQLAEKLKTETEGNRKKLAGMKAEGKLTEEAYLMLDEQLKSYEMYTDDQGEKKKELDLLEKTAEADLELLKTVDEEAAAAVEALKKWVPDQILVGYKPAKNPGQPPEPIYDDEVRNDAEFWKKTLQCFEPYEKLEFESADGEADQEKAGQLDGLTELLSGNLLELVYPEQEKLSREKPDMTDCPSSMYQEKINGLVFSPEYTLNKLAVDEYAMLELANLLTEDVEVPSAEIEYVLCGKESDLQNVSALAAELIGIRTGMNLVYLLRDTDSKMAAAATAQLITAGAPVVSNIVQYALLSVWAAAQAVLDVRELFAGGKVPFLHTQSTFQLDLLNLLGNYKTILKAAGGRSSGTGMDYQAYLRLLLMLRSGSETDYRIMDIIQRNLRKEQPDFRIDRLYTAIDIRVDARSKRLFTCWNENILAGLRNSSEYTVAAESYIEY